MAEAKKTTTKKVANKPVTKKTTNKNVAKKTTSKQTVAKKTTSKQTVAKKTTTKKVANKPIAKKTTKAKKIKKPVLMKLENIQKNYGKVEVLKGISFEVNVGERVAIVGANGAGKSTLSEIIAKVKEPSKGKIHYFFEENYKESKGKSEISKNIGIQFQDSSYPDFYKVEDLVEFIIGAAELKISKNELNELYKTFDLDKLRKEVAKGLSGGQQQRLNILLAIVNNPKLLILDEVGTGLDVESRTKIKSYIKNYANDHEAAILLVSHNSDEVMELVDRVIVIHNGKIFEDRPLDNIIEEWKQFDSYMNNLYLNVFKKDLDMRVNKSGRSKSKRG